MAAKLSALYYPHLSIGNEGLLKNALLLWDRVELICPFGELPYWPNTDDQRAAFKLLAQPLQPSEEEMRSAHEAILEVADLELPDWFFPERVNKEFHYRVFPGKFLPETWEALKRTKLAKPVLAVIDPPAPPGYISDLRQHAERAAYETTQAFGLTMFSILADCCGGSTKQLVTDEADSYIALDRYLKLIGGSRPLPWWSREKSHERLVTLSIEVADLSAVSLTSLVSMRDREATQPRLRTMRHNYVHKIDAYITRLSSEARSPRDVSEIERCFQAEVADDIALLREELKGEGKKILFSKEMLGAAAIAAGGVFVSPAAGSLIAAGALYRAKTEYRAARNKTLEKHSMSWLYEMKKVKIF